MATEVSDSPNTSSAVAGCAKVAFSLVDGRTRVTHLESHQPLKVLVPHPSPDDIPSIVLANVSGGLVGGDKLDVTLRIDLQAQATASTQAAEKVYQSAEKDCLINLTFSVADYAWLEWIPHETILFDGSRMRRKSVIDVAQKGKAMAGDILVFGRIARGENLTHGLLHDEWAIRVANRLVWTDSLHWEDDVVSLMNSPTGFNGSTAMASFFYIGEDAPLYKDRARLLITSENLFTGVTCFDGLLVARWLGRDAVALRRSFGNFWSSFRNMTMGLPPTLPRIWNI